MKKIILTALIITSSYCLASSNDLKEDDSKKELRQDMFLKEKQKTTIPENNTSVKPVKNEMVVSEPIQEIVMKNDEQLFVEEQPRKNEKILSSENKAIADIQAAKESIIKLNNPELDKDYIVKDFDEMIKIIKKYEK